MFFGATAERAVYAQGRYAARGHSETSNRADSIYREAGNRALFELRRKGAKVGAGYTGSLVIGVSPSGGR